MKTFFASLLTLLAFGARAATVTWTGGGGSQVWSVAGNWSPGLPVSGDDLTFAGAASLATVNNRSPNPFYGRITLSAPGYVVSGTRTVGTTNGIFVTHAGGETTFSAFTGFSGRARCHVESPDAILHLFYVSLSGGGVTFDGAGTTTVELGMGGTGDLIQNGPGRVVLGGNACCFEGGAIINGGTLEVNGLLDPLAGTELNAGGTLSGNGELGNVRANAGTVAPGNELPGTLTVGSMTLSPTSALHVRLNDAPNDSDLLTVLDQLDIAGATLNVTLENFPFWGTSYRIIESTNAGAIGGTFAGLPDGATLDVNGTQLRINYHADFGKAVELTVVSRPLLVTGIECLSDGSKQLYLDGNALASFVIEASTNLVDWIALGTNQPNATGQLQFTDPDAALTAGRFYRARTQ